MIYLRDYRDSDTGLLVGGPYPILDAIDCVVTEERNGMFNLVMRYPIGAPYSEKLIPDAIIMASPRPNAVEEPFRIIEIEQVIEGVITIRANHIAYDLDGRYTVSGNELSFNGTVFSVLIARLNTRLAQAPPIGFELAGDGIVDSETVFSFKYPPPITYWAIIGMIAEQFDAEIKYTWDSANSKCIITFCASRGTAKKTVISYGVNIISLNRKLSVEGLYSRVTCFWQNSDGSQTALGYSTTLYTKRVRNLIIDVSSQFSTKPSFDTLQALAASYIKANNLLYGNPKSDLSVSFVPMENVNGFSSEPLVGSAIVGISKLVGATQPNHEILYLCDTATVDASLIGVTATAKCVKVEYNVLTNKYDSVTVGTLSDTIVDTILKIGG